jgi:hypothetical protein
LQLCFGDAKVKICSNLKFVGELVQQNIAICKEKAVKLLAVFLGADDCTIFDLWRMVNFRREISKSTPACGIVKVACCTLMYGTPFWNNKISPLPLFIFIQ